MKVLSPTVALSVGAIFAVNAIGQVDALDCAAPASPEIADLATNGAVEITAEASDCAVAGKHPYISSLIIVPTAGGSTTKADYTVTFAHGATPTAIEATVGDCDVKYTNVGNTKDVTDAVKATITCTKDTGCKLDYKAEFACYTAPAPYFTETLSKTWRRKATSGDGCIAPSADTCFDVCSKGYAVTATKDAATSKVTLSLASQVKSDTCKCETPVTAEATDGLSASGTKVTLDYDIGGVTVVTTQSDDKKCTATYVEGSYNPFTTGKTYTRGTYEPSTCSAATDCEFKCNAELALTTANDKVTGKSAAVTSCTCADLTATVADDQVTAGTATGFSYTWKATATGFDLTTVKAGSPAVTCKAPYTVKAASTGSSSGTSSNSGTGSSSGSNKNTTAPTPTPTPTSGVSMNTIWAVAATAVIAVAGAFVMV